MRKTNWIIFSGIVSTLIPHTFASAQAQEPILNEDYGRARSLGQLEDISLDPNDLLLPALAQTNPAANDSQDSPAIPAADLLIRSRFGIDYNSTGGGSEDFTGVEAFLPINQTAGNNVTYLNGRLNLDNDANLGTNLLIGHRALVADRIYGGYAAWDTRNTGSETFNQLGAGFESLGENYDWRINGYLPVGNTERGGTSTPQISAARFQGNTLLLDILNAENNQSALSSIDAEVGTKLANLGNGGALRGFGGVYYRDGAGVDGSIGGSLRLEAEPIETVNLSAGVQYDEIFGTNVLFQIGVSLPSSSASSSENNPEPGATYSRIADSVVRNNAIVVSQTISSTLSPDVAAVDPNTGTAYALQHVSPGTAGGDGSAESPVDTIAAATGLANSGDIIYVQPGNAGGGFTIPDGVQVRSVGPAHTVATQFGDVQLPGSGTGTLPVIDGAGVVLGNNTTLSGFEINNAPGDAITGNNLENVTIQNNRTDSASGAGIKLENVSGTVMIEDNQLNNSDFDTGIFISTDSAAIIQELNITNNTINSNAEQGILINTSNTAQVNADIQNNTLAGNNTADPAKTGIEVETDTVAPGSVCLNLNGNISDTNYTLTLFPDSQFQVVDLNNLNLNNTGTVTLVDTSATLDFADTATCSQ